MLHIPHVIVHCVSYPFQGPMVFGRPLFDLLLLLLFLLPSC